MHAGNAGTVIRPLTAALAVIGGDYQLRGMEKPSDHAPIWLQLS